VSHETLATLLAEASSPLGVANACAALGMARATYYRKRQDKTPLPLRPPQTCRVPGRALTQEQQQQVWEHLHSERFQDKAPPQIVATLLDEGLYLCSVSTMYRLLHTRNEVQERRQQRAPSTASRPELLASGPNQVWSWDITKLKGPKKWSYYYLYVIIDIFSRAVVGWCLAEKENALLAEALIQETLLREAIVPGTLTLHADRGSAMTSLTVAELLVELGVDKSHSRPHTSDDNPFSESHFKTMKSRPHVPERFASVLEARTLFTELFAWYNNEHRHSGIAMLTPAMVPSGIAPQVLSARAAVLTDFYAAHPERFVNHAPVPAALPPEVWINPPLLPVEAALPPAESSRDASGDNHATTA
jgi:putative transposase